MTWYEGLLLMLMVGYLCAFYAKRDALLAAQDEKEPDERGREHE